MSHHRFYWKTFIFWSLAVAAILGIAFFTFQKGSESANLTNGLLAACVDFCRRIGVPESVISSARWNDFKEMRRLAHTVEYFVLGIFVALAFHWTLQRRARRQSSGSDGEMAPVRFPAVRSFIFCACVSVCDQLVKGTRVDKEFDFRDFPYDVAGYVTAIAIVYVCVLIRRAYIRRSQKCA
jgi:hypothetical protein